MAQEELPEGTDAIIMGAGGASAAQVPADEIEDVPAARSDKTGGSDAASTKAEAPTGNWFDRIDDLKSQGYDSARAYAVSGKERATGALDELLRTVNDAADQIDAKIGGGYGDYARRAAEGIAGFNDTLKAKDVDELFGEARALVARAPAVAVGTAAALGFVVARLARAGLPEDGAARGVKPGPTS